MLLFTNLISSDVAKWLQTDSDFLVEVDEYQEAMELTESQRLAKEKKEKNWKQEKFLTKNKKQANIPSSEISVKKKKTPEPEEISCE